MPTTVQYSPFEQPSGSVPVDTVVVSGAGFANWVSRSSGATVVNSSALAASGSGALLQTWVTGASQWSYLSGINSAIPTTSWVLEADVWVPAASGTLGEAMAIGVGRASDPSISNPDIFFQWTPDDLNTGIWSTGGFGAFVSAAYKIPRGRYVHIAFQYSPDFGGNASVNRFEVLVSGEKIITIETSTFSFSPGIDSIQLHNTISGTIPGAPGAGPLWDNVKMTFGLQYGAVIDQDTDSAEFDWEADSVQVSQVIPLTEFVNDIYAFRCRIINIPACVRRVRATNACRRMDVAPEVLH